MKRLRPLYVYVLTFVVVAALSIGVTYLARTHTHALPLARTIPTPSASVSLSPVPVSATAKHLEECAATDNAELTGTQLSGFTKFLSLMDDKSPLSSLPGYPPPLEDRDFLRSTTVGYVTDVAYQPKWIAQDQAYEKSMGYKVMSTPSFPLQGGIVETMPTAVLEVYQTNTVLATAEAAEQWQGSNVAAPGGSSGLGGTVTRTLKFPQRLGLVDVYEAQNVPASEEDEFNVNFVQGDLQVNLLFKGGHDMTLPQIEPWVQDAISRVDQSCKVTLATTS